MMRTCTRTLHVDTDLSPYARDQVRAAADTWRKASEGRIDLQLVFDLDFSDEAGAAEHAREGHSMVLAVHEDYPSVVRLDAQLSKQGIVPLAATTSSPGRDVVILIMDRMTPESFLGIVMHEFGHVAGFKDLTERNSVMSGIRDLTVASAEALTPLDITACRDLRYCR